MKRIGIIFVLIVLIFTLCSCKEGKKQYEGYDVKTRQEGEKIYVETDSSQWSSTTKEEEGVSLAVRSWKRIFNFEIEDDKFRAAQEKALRIIVNSEIGFIAGYLKTGKTEFEKVKVNTEDQKKAIKLLYDALCVIADKKGNKDGKASDGEIMELIEENIDQYSVFYRAIEVYK